MSAELEIQAFVRKLHAITLEHGIDTLVGDRLYVHKDGRVFELDLAWFDLPRKPLTARYREIREFPVNE